MKTLAHILLAIAFLPFFLVAQEHATATSEEQVKEQKEQDQTAQQADKQADKAQQAETKEDDSAVSEEKEQQPADATENQAPAQKQETKQSAQTAPEEGKVTMTTSEIQTMVKKMVAEEVARREAEKQQAEMAEKIAEKEEKEKEKKDFKKDTTPAYGFILPQFTKSSIAFLMGDDNLRDNSQYSPKWDIGYRDEYEDFYDRFYGYNSLGGATSRLTLFHQEDAWIPHTVIRMGIALKMGVSMESLTDNVETFLKEDGSYLMTHTTLGKHVINFTFYPFNADRIAIGYFRGMRWGTKNVFPQNSTIVPGFQALYGYGPVSFYVGFKAHMQDKVDKLSHELVPKETVYGLFGGVTYADIFKKTHHVRAQVQGAFVNKGENVILSDELLKHDSDDSIYSYGLDAFAQYNWGSVLGDPIGTTSYGDREWIHPEYKGSWAFRFRGEYMFLDERLMNGNYLGYEDGTGDVSVTDNYAGHAAGIEVSGRWKGLRLFTLFSYRTLEFLTFDAPGVNPFSTLPSSADKSDEVAFSASLDYHVWLLWFGATFGYKVPATYTVYDTSGQKQVTVIKDRLATNSVSNAFSRTREVLPEGKDAVDIMFISANIRFELSRAMNASLEYRFTKDHNRAKMVETKHPDGSGTGEFKYDWDDEKVRNIHSLFFSVEGRF